MIRRIRSLAASIIDIVVSPFGWDVYVAETDGLPGIDHFSVVRRFEPRPRRLSRHIDAPERNNVAFGSLPPS